MTSNNTHPTSFENNTPFPAGYFGSTPTTKGGVDERTTHHLPKHRRTLRTFIESLPHNAQVLDAGCGKGKFMNLIQTLRPDVVITGVDISNTAQHMPTGVTFRVGSIEELSTLFPAERFDAILCLHVLEHLDTPIRAMHAMLSVLKKDGRIYIELPNWVRTLMPFSDQHYFWNDYTHKRIFSPVTLERLVGDFGATLIALETKSSSTWTSHTPPSSHSVKGVNAVTSYVHTGPCNRIKHILSRIISPLFPDILIAVIKK